MTPLTITFLHGFMGDPSDWDSIRSELSDDSETLAPSLRPARNWESGVEQLVEELPERSILVGYSMGARLALAIAVKNPEKCDGLVFVSGNPGLEDDDARKRRYAGDCRIANRIEREPREQFLHHWYTESTVFKSLTDRVREDEIQRKTARVADDWSEMLRTYSIAKQPDYWPRLSELSMPVLAIAGLSDRKFANIVVRMGSKSNVATRIVPHCGHIVHREQPHVFLRLLKEYLATHFSDRL